MKRNLQVILLSFFYLISSQVSGQDDRIATKESIAREEKLIEAKGYALINRSEKAEKILLELYRENRSDAAVAYELSKLYAEDLEKKQKYIKVAADNDSSNEYYLKALGESLMGQEDYEKATSTFQKLVSLQPSDEEYSNLLAACYTYQAQPDKAIAVYDRLQQRIGLNEDIARKKFELYKTSGNKSKAIAELNQLISIAPENISARHALASYLMSIGKGKEAKKVYQSILDIDINDTKANIALMENEDKSENDGNYLRALAPIVDNKNVPIDSKVRELIPYIEKYNTAPEQELGAALEELSQRLVAIHNDDAKAFAARGDILYSLGNISDAIKAYEKTLTLDDKVYPVWEQLMMSYKLQKEYDKLYNRSELAVDFYLNQPSAYYFYGLALRKKKEYGEAISYLNDGVLVAGKNQYWKSNVLAELAINYALDGKIDKADSKIKESITLSNGENPLAIEIYGDILFLSGQVDAALAEWKKAQNLGSLSTDIEQKISQKKLLD